MGMVSELSWKTYMRPGGILRVFVTSVAKNPDKLLRDAREYEKRFLRDLDGIRQPVSRVDFYFDSVGGAVNSAQGMLSAIYRRFGKTPGRVLIDGMCGSAATIVAFGIGGPAYITERSTILIHRPKMLDCMRRGGIWAIQEKAGKSATVRIMLEAYRGKTKRPRKEIRKWIDEGRRFSPGDACEAGLCERIMSRAEFESIG